MLREINMYYFDVVLSIHTNVNMSKSPVRQIQTMIYFINAPVICYQSVELAIVQGLLNKPVTHKRRKTGGGGRRGAAPPSTPQ